MSGEKYDAGKPPWDVVPFEVLDELVKILNVGVKKYGKPSGWQYVEDMENRYFAALMRHLSAYRQGERTDPESGELHISHALCNVVFLVWKELEKGRSLEKPPAVDQVLRPRYQPFFCPSCKEPQSPAYVAAGVQVHKPSCTALQPNDALCPTCGRSEALNQPHAPWCGHVLQD